MSESTHGFRRALAAIVGKRTGIGPDYLAEELDISPRQVYRLSEALPGEPHAPMGANGNRGFLDMTKNLLDECKRQGKEGLAARLLEELDTCPAGLLPAGNLETNFADYLREVSEDLAKKAGLCDAGRMDDWDELVQDMVETEIALRRCIRAAIEQREGRRIVA